MSINIATNRYASANIIVAPAISQGAMFTDLPTAVNFAQASGIKDIKVKPGTYSGDFTLFDGLSIEATKGYNLSTTIQGKISAPSTGNCYATIKGFNLATNSDYLFEDTGSGTGIINYYDCFLLAANIDNDLIHIDNSSRVLNFYNSIFNLQNGYKVFDIGDGNLNFNFSQVYATGYTTYSTISGAGILGVNHGGFSGLVHTLNTSTGWVGCQHSKLLNTAGNPILLLESNAISYVDYCQVEVNASKAITVNGSHVLQMRAPNYVISNDASAAIDGTGTIRFGIVSFAGSQSKVSVSTIFVEQAEIPSKFKLDAGDWSVGDIIYASTTAQVAKLPIGSEGKVLTVNSGVPSWQTAGGGSVFDSQSIGFFDDFVSGYLTPSGESGFYANQAVSPHLHAYGGGTGATITYDDITEAGGWGKLILNTGTNATAYYGVFSRTFRLGNGNAIFETKFAVPVLPTSSAEFQITAGFSTDIAASYGASSPNCTFQYSYGGGLNLRIYSSNGTTNQYVDSGITVVANTWYKLRVEINSALNEAHYYINDTEVSGSPFTTLLPSSSADMRAAIGIGSGSSSTGKIGWFDYVALSYPMTTR